jgi:hypothetical protein
VRGKSVTRVVYLASSMVCFSAPISLFEEILFGSL